MQKALWIYRNALKLHFDTDYKMVEIYYDDHWYTEKNSWGNFTQLSRLNLGHKDIWAFIKS